MSFLGGAFLGGRPMPGYDHKLGYNVIGSRADVANGRAAVTLRGERADDIEVREKTDKTGKLVRSYHNKRAVARYAQRLSGGDGSDEDRRRALVLERKRNAMSAAMSAKDGDPPPKTPAAYVSSQFRVERELAAMRKAGMQADFTGYRPSPESISRQLKKYRDLVVRYEALGMSPQAAEVQAAAQSSASKLHANFA